MSILNTRSHVLFSSSSGARPGAACHVQRSGDLRTVYSYCRVGINGRRTMTTNDRPGHGNAWNALRNNSCESRVAKVRIRPSEHEQFVEFSERAQGSRCHMRIICTAFSDSCRSRSSRFWGRRVPMAADSGAASYSNRLSRSTGLQFRRFQPPPNLL